MREHFNLKVTFLLVAVFSLGLYGVNGTVLIGSDTGYVFFEIAGLQIAGFVVLVWGLIQFSYLKGFKDSISSRRLYD